jgi:hypothetical protein
VLVYVVFLKDNFLRHDGLATNSAFRWLTISGIANYIIFAEFNVKPEAMTIDITIVPYIASISSQAIGIFSLTDDGNHLVSMHVRLNQSKVFLI